MGMYERQLLGYNTKLLTIGGKLLRLFATGLYTFDEVNTLIYTEGYIPVATPDEMVAMRYAVSQTMGAGSPWEGTYTTGYNKKYIQVNKLDFSLLAAEYEPDSTAFSGTFDGNELMITNFNVTETSDKLTGLFFGNTGTIKNIRVTANISFYNAGGIVAQINNGTIDNCITFGSIEKNTTGGGNPTVGGICGTNGDVTGTPTISNCINYASVTSTFNVPVGGIAGQAINCTGTIENCTNYGTINGVSNAAGIIGNGTSTTTTGCKNYGAVTGTTNTGGIAGTGSSATSTSCINYGDITGTSPVGGIFGLGTSATTTGCKNYGIITATGNNTGGIIGSGAGCLAEECENHGAVDQTGLFVGGIVGLLDSGGDVLYCTNTAAITGTVGHIGGIVGRAYSTLSANHSTIKYCSNTGSVTNSAASATSGTGGLVGALVQYADLENSYNTGTITASNYVGGATGWMVTAPPTVLNCYSMGIITSAGTYRGGLVGRLQNGTVTNSYYDSQTSGMSDTGKGLPRTTAQMKYGTASSFINSDGTTDATEDPANAMYTAWSTDIWDFLTTADYPELKPEV